MKPDFALILSFQGIGLLYRGAPGWQSVGDVRLDSPDLNADLADLRARAEALAPGPALCKLVIPDDQIKYLDLEADGDPEQAVRAALDGATPYDVDDLSYDWSAQDGRIYVAAVALETLAEAEAFATEHDFAPISFAAMPSEDKFAGEPFFGATRQAARHVPEDAEITRDTEVIAVVGRATIPTPQPKQAPVTPKQDASPKTDAAKAPTDDSVDAKPAKAAEKAAKPDPDDPAVKAKAKPAKADSAPVVTAAKTSKPAPDAEAPAKDAPVINPTAKDAPATFASIRARRDDQPAGSAPALAGQPRLSSLDGATLGAPSVSDAKDDLPVAPPLPGPGGEALNPPPRMAEIAASLRPDPEARLERSEGPAAALASAKSGIMSFFNRRKSSEKPAKPAAAKTKKIKPKKINADKVKAPKSAAETAVEDERQRMTVFGARQHEVGGKPRFLGLILMALLLLFLVGVAAWASLFLDDGLSRLFGPREEIRLTDTPAEDTTANVAEADDPIAVVPQIQIPAEPVQDAEVAAVEPEITPLPQSDIAALPDAPDALSPSEALARYAATGIWQMAPPPPDAPAAQTGLDGLYQVSLDPSVARPKVSDRQETGPFGRLDVRPDTPPDPPPPGVLFDFDDNGFVRATPEGAMTPQGVRVFAGRPTVRPPAVMQQVPPTSGSDPPAVADTAPEADVATETTEGADSESATASTDPYAATDVVVLDPALASLRPRLRPESVTAEAEDAAEAEPVTDAALAGLRPRLRPDSVTAQAATLRSTQDTAAIPLVDTAAVDRALAEVAQSDADRAERAESEPETTRSFENALPQAVSASLVPLQRPDNFDAIVKQTRTEEATTPVAATQQLQPSLPSAASVAKQATEKNAINLRKVNLIGVYGTPASRRALVRLGNGRYKKVQVGDKLDGGQVAAIGDSELRYVKRGRAVILQMPKG
ncbi:hypothetical protein OO012_00840 [Rhodobacteraceae bacterium KMM 6894]|nr:hypothetical protein [Rhodobacteraceae bacterium KMM 6894]